MNKKYFFTVTPLPLLFYCSLFAIATAAIIPIGIGIMTSEPLFLIPASLGFIIGLIGVTYQKRVKIIVKDHTITVRPWIGRKYSFDVSQIVKVNWKSVHNKNGVNEVIRIKTTVRRRRVEIGSMMEGAEDMMEYILENVDSGKILRTYLDLGSDSKE